MMRFAYVLATVTCGAPVRADGGTSPRRHGGTAARHLRPHTPASCAHPPPTCLLVRAATTVFQARVKFGWGFSANIRPTPARKKKALLTRHSAPFYRRCRPTGTTGLRSRGSRAGARALTSGACLRPASARRARVHSIADAEIASLQLTTWSSLGRWGWREAGEGDSSWACCAFGRHSLRVAQVDLRSASCQAHTPRERPTCTP